MDYIWDEVVMCDIVGWVSKLAVFGLCLKIKSLIHGEAIDMTISRNSLKNKFNMQTNMRIAIQKMKIRWFNIKQKEKKLEWKTIMNLTDGNKHGKME